MSGQFKEQARKAHSVTEEFSILGRDKMKTEQPRERKMRKLSQDNLQPHLEPPEGSSQPQAPGGPAHLPLLGQWEPRPAIPGTRSQQSMREDPWEERDLQGWSTAALGRI